MLISKEKHIANLHQLVMEFGGWIDFGFEDDQLSRLPDTIQRHWKQVCDDLRNLEGGPIEITDKKYHLI